MRPIRLESSGLSKAIVKDPSYEPSQNNGYERESVGMYDGRLGDLLPAVAPFPLLVGLRGEQSFLYDVAVGCSSWWSHHVVKVTRGYMDESKLRNSVKCRAHARDGDDAMPAIGAGFQMLTILSSVMSALSLPCPSRPILTRQAACPVVLSAMATWRVSPCKITDHWIFLPWGSARPPTLGVPPVHHETGSSSSLFPAFCCDSMIFCSINVCPFPLVSFSLPLPPSTTHSYSVLSQERRAEMGSSVMGQEALLHGMTKESSPEGQHWRLNAEKEKEWVLNISRASCSAPPRGENKCGDWVGSLPHVLQDEKEAAMARGSGEGVQGERRAQGHQTSLRVLGTRVLRLLFWVIQELELKL